MIRAIEPNCTRAGPGLCYRGESRPPLWLPPRFPRPLPMVKCFCKMLAGTRRARGVTWFSVDKMNDCQPTTQIRKDDAPMTTPTQAPTQAPTTIEPTTLLFDSEKSAESYVHLYANEPGVQGPLWPAPIPVLGVSAKIGQGKTTFILDIAAGPVHRIDIPAEMMKRHPGGYRPADTFAWFWAAVKAIPPGKFRVIGLDVGEEIDAGCADYVWEHPTEFNKTRQQFIQMSGMYQGVVSSLWKSVLMDIASRCETFAFANHVGLVFDSSGKPIAGKTKSKGRPVMKESASLYINLTREKDATGNLKDVPAGVVDLSEGGKSRLMTWAMRGGVRKKVPVLPPRMPVATPQAIRDYFLNPPDTTALKDAEKAPERLITDDDRKAMDLEIARQQSETESLKLQRIEAERRAAQTPVDVPQHDDQEPTPTPPIETPPAGVQAEMTATTTPATPPPTEATAAVKWPRNLKGKIVATLKNCTEPIPFTTLAGGPDATPEQYRACLTEMVQDGKIQVVQRDGKAYAFAEKRAVPPAWMTPAASNGTPPPPASNGNGTGHAPAPAATAPAPSSPQANGYVRPAMLPADPLDAVKKLHEELLSVAMKLPRATVDSVWQDMCTRNDSDFTGKSLTPTQLADIERRYVEKITEHYEKAGTPEASPFRAAAGTA